MNAAAERREHADAPVAELVATAFDDDGFVVGHDAGGFGLVGEVTNQVLRRLLVEIVMPHEPLDGGASRQMPQRADELADVSAEFEGAPGRVRLPERHLAGLPGRRRDQHAIVRNLFDAPAGSAEQECFSDAALEHHLFVELTDPRAGPSFADEEHAVQTPVRDRTAVDDRDPLRAVARAEAVVQPVPRQPRTQVREIVGRIAS